VTPRRGRFPVSLAVPRIQPRTRLITRGNVTRNLAPVTVPATVPATGSSQASVAELLASGRTSWSFEFFAPKTPDGERAFWDALRRLENLSPTFVSMTYGAGGSNRDGTIRLTERLATETTLTVVGHLTAVAHSVGDLRGVIGQYAGAGIRNVLALRGDPPGNPTAEWVKHPEGLEFAHELVDLVRSLGDFSVGVAAFPEKHPRARDLDHDAEVLASKFAAGAGYAITQMFFGGADDYFRLVDRLAKLGWDRPIIPGVMPITNVAQVERSAQLTGAAFPTDLSERLHAAADLAAVREIGVEVATDLCERLIAGGAPGIHFITLNRSSSSGEVYANLTGRGGAATG
jgi:methylenetetrahydrofolate reductase (NADPH)